MERIKEAIAKARSQTGQLPQKSNSGSVLGASRTQPVKHSAVESIEYENTQTIHLDPVHLEKYRIVAPYKNERASWAIDLLRTQVLQLMDENKWRTLAIVSPTPEAGKTVVAINLAISIAQQSDRSVLLVDFDLRRPKIGAYLGLPAGKSLNDFFDGNATLSSIMVNPEFPRLVVVPTNYPVRNSAEVLSSKKVESLVDDMRDRYDSRIIIFDLPPLLSADDAIAIMPKIDCMLMVVGNGMSKPSEIEEAMHHLNTANLVGVVLNKAEPENTRNYY